jgi:hypothetical protein
MLLLVPDPWAALTFMAASSQTRPSSHGLIQTLALMWRSAFRKGKAAMPSGEKQQQLRRQSSALAGQQPRLTLAVAIAGSISSGCNLTRIQNTQVSLFAQNNAVAAAAVASVSVIAAESLAPVMCAAPACSFGAGVTQCTCSMLKCSLLNASTSRRASSVLCCVSTPAT